MEGRTVVVAHHVDHVQLWRDLVYVEPFEEPVPGWCCEAEDVGRERSAEVVEERGQIGCVTWRCLTFNCSGVLYEKASANLARGETEMTSPPKSMSIPSIL